MQIINFLSILLSPVIAVLVSIWLTDRSNKRKECMEVFKTLMSTRYIIRYTHEQVRAMNSIDVIFADVPRVRTAWKELHNEYKNPNVNFGLRQDKMLVLLESMADYLGYKNKIKWDSIKNYYIPEGLAKKMDDEEELRQYQLDVMRQSKEQNNIPTIHT